MTHFFRRSKFGFYFQLFLVTTLVCHQITYASPIKEGELVPVASEETQPETRLRPWRGPGEIVAPAGTALVVFSMMLPTVMAQSTSTPTPTPTEILSSPVINSTVACIVARELLEGGMFVISHIGAVVKNPNLTREEKQHYLRGLVPAIVCGVATGGIISVGIGFGVAHATQNLDSVAAGVELGEAISKTIGAFFVTSMTLEIPKWFGISRYPRDRQQGDQNVELANQTPAQQQAIASRLAMSLSLFWNTLRESGEGGTLTALTTLLSPHGKETLGASVGVGVGSAAALGTVFGLGAKYVSAAGFGIAAAGLSELLSIGLITGAVRSYEEVYAYHHNDTTSHVIYDFGDTQKGDILSAFEFAGISDNLTALQLSALLISSVTITGVQIWHHGLGLPLAPKVVKNWVNGAKEIVKSPFKKCWNWVCSQ